MRRGPAVVLALLAAGVVSVIAVLALAEDPASGGGAAVGAPRGVETGRGAPAVPDREPASVDRGAPEVLAAPPVEPVTLRAAGSARLLDPWSVRPAVLPLGGDVPAELTISGRVVGRDGLGVEGVEVTALTGGSASTGADALPQPHRRWRTAAGVPLLRGVDLASAPRSLTARDGSFALRVPWGQPAVDAGDWTTARPLHVLVRHPGRAAVTRGVAPHRVRGDTADLGEIMLAAAATLSGRVLDESGRPVAGATVAAEAVLPEQAEFVWTGLSLRVSGVHSTRTDEAGWYVLDELYCGVLDVSASAPGHERVVRRGVELPCDGHARDLDPLVLTAGRAVEGRVVDERGAPVPGATVFAAAGGAVTIDAWGAFVADDRASAWGLHVAAEDATRRAVTDPDGRFRIAGLPDEELLLVARADGREPSRVLVAPDARDARLVLRPQACWRVRVVDETGAAAHDVEVFALRLGLRAQEHLPLDVAREDDAFVIAGAGPHGTLLDVSAPGLARTFLEAPGLDPGARRELVVTLPVGARLLGRLVDDRGDPLPDQPVRIAEGWGSFDRTGLANGRTDADGRFVADGLRAGWHWIEAGEKPWPTVRQRVEVADGVDLEVVVTVQDLFGARDG